MINIEESIEEIKKTSRRGFDEEDYKWFSHEAISKLRKAQEEVLWLLNRGYKINSIIELIGGHYQFSVRQRIALKRGTASNAQCKARREKVFTLETEKESFLYIDGFNLIITLEVALSGGVLVLGNDGVIRDLAGLRGTYKLIDKIDMSILLIKRMLQELKVTKVKFFLDAPVSNSGRLKVRILELLNCSDINALVELVPNADVILSKHKGVVTGDSAILDKCESWVNLSRNIVEEYIKEAWIVSFE